MKLDENSKVYINCKTQEERDMIIDILRSLGCHWPGKTRLDGMFYGAPMHFELDKRRVRHGRTELPNTRTTHGYTIVNARDFRNQWIALKKNIDK